MKTMAATGTYVLKQGLRYGPYSLSELQKQLDTGFFASEDFVSPDGNETWMPLLEFPGLTLKNFTVEVDASNNLLVICYSGKITSAIVQRCFVRVREALDELQPEFQLLVDLTELESMDASCIPQLERIMRLCDQKGVCTVVRIIPDPKRDIGLQILSHFHYGPHVRVMTCALRDEAMARLAM